MINVSICDGLSGTRIAWDRVGLGQAEWHVFETDKYASAVSRYNYPDMTRHGDARNYTKLIGQDVYLLVAGFPCQPYSVAGSQSGNDDARDLSQLCFDALRDLKPKYFIFENVASMKQEHKDYISQGLGVEPVMIDGAYFSGQSRKRLFWTNIDVLPYQDKGIVIRDILETGDTADIVSMYGKNPERLDIDKASCLMARDYKGFGRQAQTGVRRVGTINSGGQGDRVYSVDGKAITLSSQSGGTAGNGNMLIQVGETAEIKGHDIIKRVYSVDGKAPSLTTMQGGHREPKIATADPTGGRIVNRRKVNGVRKDNDKSIPLEPYIETRTDGKSNCLSTVQKDNVVVQEMTWRKLTPLECERLQTIDDNATALGDFDDGDIKPISNSQRYKMLGNGFVVDVVGHILKTLSMKKYGVQNDS